MAERSNRPWPKTPPPGFGISEKRGRSPRDSAAAWDREEPSELRLAADEWEALGHRDYAEHLRRWAAGDRSGPYVRRPL